MSPATAKAVAAASGFQGVSVDVYERGATAFRQLGMGYILEPTTWPIRLEIDMIHDTSAGFAGEIDVRYSGPPKGDRHLHHAMVNLTNTTGKTNLAKTLAAMTTPGMTFEEWQKAIETFGLLVLQAHRQGSKLVKVGRMDKPQPRWWAIDEVLVGGGATLMIGPGGVGKSQLAAFFCAQAVLGLPFLGREIKPKNPLYLDWEDNAEELDARVKAVAYGLGVEPPEFDYLNMKRGGPLYRQINRVAKIIAEHGHDLVIVDSYLKAQGSMGDRGNYEDIANRLFESIDFFGPVSTLILHHLSADSMKNGKAGKRRGFGSVMIENSVRHALELASEQEPGADALDLGLFHYKGNRGGSLAPLGFRYQFSHNSAGELVVKLEPREVQQMKQISAERENIATRIRNLLLREGSLTAEEIAESLQLTLQQVRTRLSSQKYDEKKARGTFVQASKDGRVIKWGVSSAATGGHVETPKVVRIHPERADDDEALAEWVDGEEAIEPAHTPTVHDADPSPEPLPW